MASYCTLSAAFQPSSMMSAKIPPELSLTMVSKLTE